jgi:hypothetical protein
MEPPSVRRFLSRPPRRLARRRINNQLARGFTIRLGAADLECYRQVAGSPDSGVVRCHGDTLNRAARLYLAAAAVQEAGGLVYLLGPGGAAAGAPLDPVWEAPGAVRGPTTCKVRADVPAATVAALAALPRGPRGTDRSFAAAHLRRALHFFGRVLEAQSQGGGLVLHDADTGREKEVLLL